MRRFLILFLLLPLFAGAQVDTVSDGGREPKKAQLHKVSVKARRQASFTKMGSIEKTDVITVEGLRGLACCNLGESFQNSATVDVGYSDAVSGSRQIQLLGLTGVYSQMLLENVPFLRGLAAPFGLSFVPGQWMESISVSKGVATVKNGFESITGTINLEYEKPHKGDRFSLNVYENSDLKSEITAKINHRFSDRLFTGLLLYGAADTKRMNHVGGDGFADYPMQRQVNAVNRWHYDSGNGFVSQTLVNYIHEERLGGDMRFERSMRGSDSIWGFGGNSDRFYFMSKNGKMLSNTSSLGLQVSGSWFRQEGWYGMSEYRGLERDLYANLLYNTEVSGGHTVDCGLSLRFSDERELLDYHPWPLYSDTLSHNLRETVPGIFGQFTFRYGERFSATAGLRMDVVAGSVSAAAYLTPRLHFRWDMGQRWILRGSAGRGFRTPTLIAENIGLLASNRSIMVSGPIELEEAWNGGLNIAKVFSLGGDRRLTFTVDYYHTEFVKQTVVDLDVDANQVWIVPLSGRSFSNVVQADITVEPFEGFTATLAGKLSDVRCSYHGELMRKPYTSLWRGLLVLSYHTRFDKWRFDLTTQCNGPQRLPLNKGLLQGEAPAYIYMLGQVTRRFKRFEIYGGVENITNHVQDVPVTGYDTPFSTAFDASIVYAPLMGRMFYVGLRFNVM